MSTASLEQHSLRLTPHQFQRAGAFVFATSAKVRSPLEVSVDEFDRICAEHAEDAARAAVIGSRDSDGFFQKQSLSLFPNSAMNHAARFLKGKDPRAETLVWRTIPDKTQWPDAVCALCSAQAVGFYGNASVPLAASISHRNTTPDGHDGYPLCWPCLACFFALPYACRLTGGELNLLHSWDEGFMTTTVRRQARLTRQHITLGVPTVKGSVGAKEVTLDRLRRYSQPLTDGVELMVFSNFNGAARLAVHRLDQPLAEWLRDSTRPGAVSRGFTALLAAHRRPKLNGLSGLARNVFSNPERVLTSAAHFAADKAIGHAAIPDYVSDLAAACRTYAAKVLSMDNKDIAELSSLARNIAEILKFSPSAGGLNAFRSELKDRQRARPALEKMAVQWLLDHAEKDKPTDPLMTPRALLLLFDPSQSGWLHRSFLMIAVLEQLHAIGCHSRTVNTCRALSSHRKSEILCCRRAAT